MTSADPVSTRPSADRLGVWWRLLSGFSHAKMWSAVEAMERSGSGPGSRAGTVEVGLTCSAALVALSMHAGVGALEQALRLYGIRAHDWSSQPEDVAEPHDS